MNVQEYKERHKQDSEWLNIPKGESAVVQIPYLNDEGDFLLEYSAYPIGGSLIRVDGSREDGEIREYLKEKRKIPYVEMPNGERCYKQPQKRFALNVIKAGEDRAKVLSIPKMATNKLVDLAGINDQRLTFDSAVRFTKKSVGKRPQDIEWLVEISGEAEWTDELRNIELHDLEEVCKPQSMEEVVQRIESRLQND